jgi:hypothetical protein
MARAILSPFERVKRINHDLTRIKASPQCTHFGRSVVREIEELMKALNEELEKTGAHHQAKPTGR